MSMGNTFEGDLAGLIFHGTAIANIADNASSSPLTSFHVSLHTSSPGEAGNQETNECAYDDYERVAVTRDSSGWDIVGSVVSPADPITFPQASGGTETATHGAIGTAATSTGKVLFYGAISPNISISTGVTPQLGTGSTVTFD